MKNESVDTQQEVMKRLIQQKQETPAFKEWFAMKDKAMHKILEGCHELSQGDTLSDKDINRSSQMNALEGIICATLRGNYMALALLAVEVGKMSSVLNQGFRDNVEDIARVAGGYRIL